MSHAMARMMSRFLQSKSFFVHICYSISSVVLLLLEKKMYNRNLIPKLSNHYYICVHVMKWTKSGAHTFGVLRSTFTLSCVTFWKKYKKRLFTVESTTLSVRTTVSISAFVIAFSWNSVKLDMKHFRCLNFKWWSCYSNSTRNTNNSFNVAGVRV